MWLGICTLLFVAWPWQGWRREGLGQGLSAIGGGDQVMLRLPALLQCRGTGLECALPPAAGERWSPGGCCSCLCFSRARIASACWLISGEAGPPRQALPCVFPEVAGAQEYEGNDGIFLANKLPPQHLQKCWLTLMTQVLSLCS